MPKEQYIYDNDTGCHYQNAKNHIGIPWHLNHPSNMSAVAFPCWVFLKILLGCSCSRQPSGFTTKMAAIESWRTSMSQETMGLTHRA